MVQRGSLLHSTSRGCGAQVRVPVPLLRQPGRSPARRCVQLDWQARLRSASWHIPSRSRLPVSSFWQPACGGPTVTCTVFSLRGLGIGYSLDGEIPGKDWEGTPGRTGSVCHICAVDCPDPGSQRGRAIPQPETWSDR